MPKESFLADLVVGLEQAAAATPCEPSSTQSIVLVARAPHRALDVEEDKWCTDLRQELYSHQYLFSQVLTSLQAPHVNN